MGLGHHIILALLLVPAAACGSGPAPASPPLAPAESPPAMAWAAPVVPRIPNADLVDVAYADGVYVAVGAVYRDTGNGNLVPARPLVLRSDDGIAWSQAALGPEFNGVALTAVEGGPDGVVALGQRQDVAAGKAVALRSADGLAWTASLLPDPDRPRFPVWLVRAGDVFVAAMTDLTEPLPVELTSPDGLAWTQRQVPFQRSLVPTTAGWRGIGPVDTWTMVDGSPATGGRLPAGPGGRTPDLPTAGAVLAGGTLLAGLERWPCGPFEPGCEHLGTGASWSGDGLAWTAVPEGIPGWPFGSSGQGQVVLGDAGGVAVVAFDGHAWASTDGWRWTALAGGEIPNSGHVSAMAFGDDTVVFAGGRTLDDGITIPWIQAAVTP